MLCDSELSKASITGTNTTTKTNSSTCERPFPDRFGGSYHRLTPGKGVVVPKGVMHRPRAPERTVSQVERAGIIPTEIKVAARARCIRQSSRGQ